MSFGTPPEKPLWDLMSELNNRPDHLIAILKHKMKIPGQLGYLHLAQIDPEGRWARVYYHPPPDHKEVEVKIPFDPPADSNEEVRQRLVDWRNEAIRHFQPPKNPIVDYYSPPALFPFALPLGVLISFFLFVLFGWGHHADLIRGIIVKHLGRYVIPFSAGFAGLMHFLLEPAYMISQCRKHKTPFSSAWKWVLTVVALGVGGLNEWSDCLEYERVRYIYSKTDVGEMPPRVPLAVTKGKKDL